jgi:hypothetical protein
VLTWDCEIPFQDWKLLLGLSYQSQSTVEQSLSWIERSFSRMKDSFLGLNDSIKGTVAPVLSRLKVVWIKTVESGEVPLVVYRYYISSVNL